MKTLLDAGADANAKDVRGMTPLMLAVQTDRLDPEMIRLLLNHHADLATKSVRGGTALDWARKFRSAPVLDLLCTVRTSCGGRFSTAPVCRGSGAGEKEHQQSRYPP